MAIMDEVVFHLQSRYSTLPVSEDDSEEVNAKGQSNGSSDDQESQGSRSQWFRMIGKIYEQLSREL